MTSRHFDYMCLGVPLGLFCVTFTGLPVYAQHRSSSDWVSSQLLSSTSPSSLFAFPSPSSTPDLETTSYYCLLKILDFLLTSPFFLGGGDVLCLQTYSVLRFLNSAVTLLYFFPSILIIFWCLASVFLLAEWTIQCFLHFRYHWRDCFEIILKECWEF